MALPTLIKQHILQAIFPLTLPWFPLLLFANELTKALSEGGVLHNFSENLLISFSLAGSAFLCLILYRWRPGFLKIPKTVSFLFLLTRSIINTLGMYIIVTIIVALISLLLDPPPWKSDNVQYIPLIFFAIIFYPPVLTPSLAVISVWRSTLRKAKESQ